MHASCARARRNHDILARRNKGFLAPGSFCHARGRVSSRARVAAQRAADASRAPSIQSALALRNRRLPPSLAVASLLARGGRSAFLSFSFLLRDKRDRGPRSRLVRQAVAYAPVPRGRRRADPASCVRQSMHARRSCQLCEAPNSLHTRACARRALARSDEARVRLRSTLRNSQQPPHARARAVPMSGVAARPIAFARPQRTTLRSSSPTVSLASTARAANGDTPLCARVPRWGHDAARSPRSQLRHTSHISRAQARPHPRATRTRLLSEIASRPRAAASRTWRRVRAADARCHTHRAPPHAPRPKSVTRRPQPRAHVQVATRLVEQPAARLRATRPSAEPCARYAERDPRPQAARSLSAAACESRDAADGDENWSRVQIEVVGAAL